MTTQKRNPELVDLLSPDFLLRNEPCYPLLWYSVMGFGAKGDGVTDDTAAIQAAITAAGAGVTFFPTGQYLISAVLKVTSDYAILRGEGGWKSTTAAGKSVLILKDLCDPAYMLQVANAADTNNIKGVEIHDLVFHGGTYAQHAAGSGIHFRSNGGYIDNVMIQGFHGNGLVMEGGPTPANTIYDNTVSRLNVSSCGIDSVVIADNINDSVFSDLILNGGRYGLNVSGVGCQFIFCHPWGFTNHGMIIQAAGGMCEIVGGEYETNGGSGIYMLGGGNMVSHILAYANAGVGHVVIAGTGNNNIFDNNLAAGCTDAAIVLSGASLDNTVTGNIINGTTGTGIHVGGTSTRNIISNNSIHGLATPVQAILVDGSAIENQIIGNVCEHSIVETGTGWNRYINNYVFGGGAGLTISYYSENVNNQVGEFTYPAFNLNIPIVFSECGTALGVPVDTFMQLYARDNGAAKTQVVARFNTGDIIPLATEGMPIVLYSGSAPTTGTAKQGDITWRSNPVSGQTAGWMCTHSGTFSAATDNTGDTDGATAVITGMTDTSDFAVGDFVDVSAGFPTTGPYRILSKTANSITIDVNSNAAVNNITVDTSDPVWTAMANLA